MSPDSAFNTAVSFASNTNWQGYVGEATMSYLTQMLGLAVQNFLSAASGMAVLVALIRGFVRRETDRIGNFYVDLTRGTLYILLPLSLVLAVVLMSQGVVQSFGAYRTVSLLDPVTIEVPVTDAAGEAVVDAAGEPVMQAQVVTEQTVPLGPAASQIAIKQLGTNGGGFFNANSAHPLENPTPLSNFLEVLAILLIPAALCYTFGQMVRDTRQGWAVFAAMLVIFVPLTFGVIAAEQSGNPDPHGARRRSSCDGRSARRQHGRQGGALRYRELRHLGRGDDGGVERIRQLDARLLHAARRTDPAGLMQLGEVVFGGVGSGLYGMLMFALVAVFIAGLMVGRTPEYLGKKIEAYEMKMAALVLLIPPLVVLVGTAIASIVPEGTGSIANPDPAAHGFSEMLYAFSSAGNNNGSAFAGLSANTPFYNLALGVAMWASRYWLMIPVLAIAGSLAAKRRDGHHGRHAPDARSAVRCDARRRRADRRRTDVRALARARADRRASPPLGQRLIAMTATTKSPTLARSGFLEREIIVGAIRASFAKLAPRVQIRNPVMFVVYVGSALTTVIGIAALLGRAPDAGGPGFVLGISAWLWLTVLFANFAEAVAEGRGKAQAATLRAMRRHVHAKKLLGKLRTRVSHGGGERLEARRPRARRSQRHDSCRRRGRRRRRLGERERSNWGVGPRAS